jgi:phosphoglycolate phosphatase
MNTSRFRAVLFDMDGTLLHTAPDIAAALNRTLTSNGLAAIDIEHVARMIGRGPRILIERALQAHGETDSKRVETLFTQYVDNYAIQIGAGSEVFPGALHSLQLLHARGYRLGVVTNALQRFAETILGRFGFTDFLDVIVGGDRVAECKPHPGHVLAACRAIDVSPRATLFVGDSINDVIAARGAGCAMVGVPHGYNEGRSAETLGCPLIASLDDLPAYVEAQHALKAVI